MSAVDLYFMIWWQKWAEMGEKCKNMCHMFWYGQVCCVRPFVHRVLVGLQGGVLYNREGYVVELWGRILCVVLVYYKGTTYIFWCKKNCNKMALSFIICQEDFFLVFSIEDDINFGIFHRFLLIFANNTLNMYVWIRSTIFKDCL